MKEETSTSCLEPSPLDDITGSGEYLGSSPDPIDVMLNKREQLALLEQKIALLKSDGLSCYRPHPKQAAFHAAGATHRYRMVRSGNRFGKSTLGVCEDAAWLRNERTWLPEGDPFRRAGIPQRAVRGIVITTDWDLVDDIFTGNRGTMGKFWKVLPPDFVKSTRRNHSGSIDTLECINGSMLKFDTVKSFMSNPQGAESAAWDFIHVDEPIPQAMYKGYSRGLMDTGGSAWFTLTPLREPWINDMFFPMDGEAPTANRWAIDGSTYDNPYLRPEDILEFEATLTEDEKQCRIHGIPLHLSGLIYKSFSLAKHVLKKVPAGWLSYLQPPRDYSIYLSIDPHPQTPHCVLFCAVSPFGQRFYYTDVFDRCSIAALCEKVKRILDGRQPIRVRIDPLAYINNPITETNMSDEFAAHGIFTEKATKALEHGIMRVNQELAKPDAIYFTPEARRSIWEIQRYCWDEGENRPIDKDDHAMECLYRCELDDPIWIDPVSRPLGMEELTITAPDFTLDPIAV